MATLWMAERGAVDGCRTAAAFPTTGGGFHWVSRPIFHDFGDFPERLVQNAYSEN